MIKILPAKLEDMEKFQFHFFAVTQFSHKINLYEIIWYKTLFLRESHDNIINTRRDRQTYIETDRHRDRQTDWLTDRQTHLQTHRQTDTWIDRQTDWQTERQTDTRTDRLTPNTHWWKHGIKWDFGQLLSFFRQS